MIDKPLPKFALKPKALRVCPPLPEIGSYSGYETLLLDGNHTVAFAGNSEIPMETTVGLLK
jgi:hypothetical protein